jgi:hypothetical protein
MGCVSTVACRIWIYAIDNGGSVALGLMVCSTSTQIFSCGDELLYNTPSGTSGGSSAGTLYGSAGLLSGAAVRIIGYLEATETTAGSWDTMPSKLQLFGPGVHKPGEVVQTVFAQTGTNASAGSTFAASNVAVGITPTSGINIIEVSLSGNCNTGPGATMTVTVRRGTSTNVGQSEQVGISGSGSSGLAIDGAVAFDFLDVPPSAATYTIYFNSSTGSSVITGGHALAREIMGALDEPANDAGAPLRLVG